MAERRRRPWLLVALAWLVAGRGAAETGWATSPVIVLPSPAYSILGGTPGCAGQVVVDGAVRRVLDAIGPRGPEPDGPSRASRAVGDILNLVGLRTVFQDHATCADVCALVPLDATRVLTALAYGDEGTGSPFRVQPFDRWGDYVYWEPVLDTARTDDVGRYVCARVRNYLHGVERRVFLVIQYER